ncbi:hypothetical protein [Methylomonas fluvii]|nr:hypothetical protein [Methylomonas fluvii]
MMMGSSCRNTAAHRYTDSGKTGWIKNLKRIKKLPVID